MRQPAMNRQCTSHSPIATTPASSPTRLGTSETICAVHQPKLLKPAKQASVRACTRSERLTLWMMKKPSTKL
ncbi:MAG: hypothetical protein C4333_01040 [Meiothermus sp.]